MWGTKTVTLIICRWPECTVPLRKIAIKVSVSSQHCSLWYELLSRKRGIPWFHLCRHFGPICSEYNESRISSGLFRFASIFRADYFHYHRSISLLFFLIKLQIWVFLSTVQPLSHHPKWLMMHLTGELAAEWRERKKRDGKKERHVLTQRHTSMKMECLRKTKEQIREREREGKKVRELLGEWECVR